MVSSLKNLIEESELGQADDPEERFTTSGVSWQASIRHEKVKERLGALVEVYLDEKEYQYTPMGSPTVRNRFNKAGAEPDKCYCIGEEKEIPDIAIEVIITSGSIDKLATYRRLGVAEIWFWESNRLKLYHLREETPRVFLSTHGYEQINASEFLPELNISILEECTLISDHVQAKKEFKQSLRNPPPSV
ncbi:Uma2 family endonuclease [Scytonema sp. UIC 10036]|uniref:Uma2 family endonuclease n=1 Tax=Scytonema sp. UIC 10036 TaxID=2304196 RepID=UPI0012DA99BC|nr:Uma2 family endonuclease [Scytonema sp. UIC 10036]MUG98612.1 Uma2 family endonuclease [Scytonema sp. UIC 10036]